MLFKHVILLGLAVLTAANPILDTRAGTKGTGTAVGGAKGKGAAQCKNQILLQGPVTCPRDKFTVAQITKAVKQAKAMKLAGKKGKGLHFPAKYRPKKETKAKGTKGVKGKAGKAGKTVKRHEVDDDEELHQVLEARRARGGGSRGSKARPKPVRKTRPTKKPAKNPVKKPAKGHAKKPTGKCTAAQKKANSGKCPTTTKPTVKCDAAQKKANGGKCPAKDPCANAKAVKPGKGIYMFPILEKGVWKPGMLVEVNYIILDAKYNYVKTVEREPGSAEEYEVCVEKSGAMGGKAAGGKTTKGKKGKAV